MAMNLDESVSSPFYLHPSENPSAMHVTMQLNPTNYHTWNRAMRMALLLKNKLKFVDGSIPVPDQNDRCYSMWVRCNNMVISWIYRALTPSIAQSVSFLNYALEIWENLKERFSQGDADRISDLQAEICMIKQNTMSVSEYYTNLKILWDEFKNFRPIPICSCIPKCSCGGYELIKRYPDNDYVIRFIKGLNENFETVRSHILLLEPLPPINKAFAMALRHERQIGLSKIDNVDSADAHAFAAESVKYDHNACYSKVNSGFQKKFFNTQGKVMLCSHCGKTNHTIDRCYRKHGYPPGFFSRFRSNTPGYANQVDSGYEDTEPIVDTNTAGPSKWNSNNNHVVAAPVSTPAFPFTPEQCSQLLAMLQQTTDPSSSSQHAASYHNAHVNTASAKFSTPKPFSAKSQNPTQPTYSGIIHTCLLSTKFSKNGWLVDTGATDHIVCSLDCFIDYKPITGVFINLPNNNHVLVTHIGTVTVFSTLTLTNALYVPQFYYLNH
ncbi:uncharacterized protein LOC130015139 [Mercurialis annua]|uniref:uncharacterized protein LOC130015139 n=1 Tax=Mercurialis annua TaxID=3986 RepID=UPI0024ADA969|nr:uncharacterized protein LOC130015139 [Mercurialis annua]